MVLFTSRVNEHTDVFTIKRRRWHYDTSVSDALVGCRGDREQGSQERVLSAFLTEMDGVGIRVDLQTKHNKKRLLEGQTSDSSLLKVCWIYFDFLNE